MIVASLRIDSSVLTRNSFSTSPVLNAAALSNALSAAVLECSLSCEYKNAFTSNKFAATLAEFDSGDRPWKCPVNKVFFSSLRAMYVLAILMSTLLFSASADTRLDDSVENLS